MIFDVHPASVRAAMSAPRSRAGAKAKFALVAAAMAPHLEAASEDERDALAIGWAALGKLREVLSSWPNRAVAATLRGPKTKPGG